MPPSPTAPRSLADRPYDVVLFGATGYTGRLVAEYLAEHHASPGSLVWALAGRSREKLEAVSRELAAQPPGSEPRPVLVADASDRAALLALAMQTRVVASTVGPFALHGREVVGACAEAGTSYCDITGEPQFVREMIDRHDGRARETGARIVHCCGYDSIPSDLGVLMLQTHARERYGAPCTDVKLFAGESKGGASGGTIASMLNLVEAASRDRALRRLLADPYALDPAGADRGPDGPDQAGVRWDDDLGCWTGPFVMAAVNTRVVRRTNALLGYPWGKGFRYAESMSFPGGPHGLMAASGLAAGVVAFTGAAAIGPVRRLLAKRVLPKPGEGPSKAVREAGHFTSRLVGKGAAPADGKPFVVRAVVRGTRDPGYGETAKMLSESAACLARDALESPAGVLTPAAGMGMRLVERLRAAGMTFAIEEG